MKSIFIHTQLKFEVVLENESKISTAYSFIPNKSLFGDYFIFSPKEGVLSQGTQEIINITFDSNSLGTFKEEFVCTLSV
jgi:hypothetical protein